MPAVNPSRLQNQIEQVLEYFNRPKIFHRRIQDLFSLYANRTLHFGESSDTTPVLPKYHLPLPLTRQLQMSLKPYIDNEPIAALECADNLWEDPYIEIKQLAVFLIANVPVEEPGLIITRLESWVDPSLDDELKADLLSLGTSTIQSNFPTAWERFLQSLLDQREPKLVNFGIQGLIESVKRSKFENFPMVFRLISSVIQNPRAVNIEKLENLLALLIDESPTEAAFFMKQTLSLSQSPETKRLIKRCLPMLPEKERQDLKSSLV